MALSMWGDLSEDGWSLSFHREGLPPIVVRGSGRPLHAYGFDLQSMDLAPRCLAKTKAPARTGHRARGREPGPGCRAPLVDYGPIRVETLGEAKVGDVPCRRYRLAGKNFSVLTWFSRADGHVVRAESNRPDSHDWTSFKLQLLRTEAMDPFGWRSVPPEGALSLRPAGSRARGKDRRWALSGAVETSVRKALTLGAAAVGGAAGLALGARAAAIARNRAIDAIREPEGIEWSGFIDVRGTRQWLLESGGGIAATTSCSSCTEDRACRSPAWPGTWHRGRTREADPSSFTGSSEARVSPSGPGAPGRSPWRPTSRTRSR